MEVLSTAYYENLKRYLRIKRYQRLSGSNRNYKRKIRVTRLGSPGTNRGRLWRFKGTQRVQLKMVSPIKVLARFHEAYVNMMLYLADIMANSSDNGGGFRGKRVARGRHVALVSFGEEVDCHGDL